MTEPISVIVTTREGEEVVVAQESDVAQEV